MELSIKKCVFITLTVTILYSVGAVAQDQKLVYTINDLCLRINKFSINLLAKTAADPEIFNVAISPFSVWIMLTVLSKGAKENTKLELSRTLYTPWTSPSDSNLLQIGIRAVENAITIKTSDVHMESVTGIFSDNGTSIDPDYQKLLSELYKFEIQTLDFSNSMAAQVINNYINTSTEGQITEIVGEDEPISTILIFSTASFFKGKWRRAFDKSKTKTELFYNDYNKPIGYVEMMSRRGPFAYITMKNFQADVIELPYGEEHLWSMIVMVPNEGISLLGLFRMFEEFSLTDIFSELKKATEKPYDEDIDVFLPRFNVTSNLPMQRILEKMGTYDAFNEKYSDFSNIYSNSTRILPLIIHKTKIEVSEEGIYDSVDTVTNLSGLSTTKKFIVNKPFLYMIVDKKTNIIVFGGSFTEPDLP